MATLLLIVIYIAFIGLGVPDSLFGTAWPAIYTDLNLPVSWASIVTIIVSCGTITSSLLSSRLISRFGTGKITAVSTLMTALALLGFSCSDSMIWLCLCAIPLGLGAGSIDTALNNYVALHYKASHMNFLHCFYGIGVSLSPYLMSLALSKGTWEGGYRAVFWFQLAIAALTVLALPLWKKVRHAQNGEEEEETPRVLSFPALMKMPKVRMACLVFIGYCALEYTCGTWGSTFLVNAKGAAADTAARMVTFYYIGLALGRFLSGVLAGRLHSRQLGKNRPDHPSGRHRLAVPASAFRLLQRQPVLHRPGQRSHFPEYAPPDTGALRKRPLPGQCIGAEMATSYIGVLLAPALFGLIAQNVTAALFPVYLLVLYALDDHRDSSVGVQKGWTYHRQVTFNYMTIQTFLVQLFQASLQLSHQLLGEHARRPGHHIPNAHVHALHHIGIGILLAENHRHRLHQHRPGNRVVVEHGERRVKAEFLPFRDMGRGNLPDPGTHRARTRSPFRSEFFHRQR